MRVLLRVLAPLLGIALAGAGILLAIEVVAAWTRLTPDQRGVVVPWPDWRTALEQTHWNDGPVAWIAVGLGVLGLILILVATAARHAHVPVHPPRGDITVTTSPQVLARLVGTRVRAADEVAAASVTASKNRIAVAAKGWGDQSGEQGKALRAAVGDSVAALLDDLPLHRRPRVSVSVSQRRGPR